MRGGQGYKRRRGLQCFGCVTNKIPQASASIIHGLDRATPAHVVEKIDVALTQYQRRIGTRWRAHEIRIQAILALAYMDGGYTYRSLGAGDGSAEE